MIGAASRTARIATVTKIAETARPRIGEEATGTRTETAIETEIEIATETAIETVIEIVTASDGGIVTARTVTEKRTETRSEIATGGSPRPADGQDQRGENTARVVTVIAAEIVSTAGVETEVAEIAREIGTTIEIGVEFASTGVVIVTAVDVGAITIRQATANDLMSVGRTRLLGDGRWRPCRFSHRNLTLTLQCRVP